MTLRIVAELQPAALANLSDTTWDPTVSPEIKCSSMIADSTAWRRESGAGRPDFWGLVRLTIGLSRVKPPQSSVRPERGQYNEIARCLANYGLFWFLVNLNSSGLGFSRGAKRMVELGLMEHRKLLSRANESS